MHSADIASATNSLRHASNSMRVCWTQISSSVLPRVANQSCASASQTPRVRANKSAPKDKHKPFPSLMQYAPCFTLFFAQLRPIKSDAHVPIVDFSIPNPKRATLTFKALLKISHQILAKHLAFASTTNLIRHDIPTQLRHPKHSEMPQKQQQCTQDCQLHVSLPAC